jgi:2-iminoacetate synthase ThiH
MKEKNRLAHYLLLVLIVVFFVIPLTTICFFDCNYYFRAPQKIASIILIFFR